MLPMAPGTMANNILNNVATWTMNPVRNPGNVRQDSGNKLWLTSCRLPHGAQQHNAGLVSSARDH